MQQRGWNHKTNSKKERDSDAMDVSTVETNVVKRQGFSSLTPAEWKKLSAEGRCFNCKKQGHMAQACLDRLKVNWSKNLSKGKPKKIRAMIPESGDEDSSSDKESADSSSEESVKSKKDPKNLVTKISRMTAEEQGVLVEKILMQDFKMKKASSKTKL
jgi:hypothetical protein